MSPGYFVLPAAAQDSDFVVGQDWFEARERCQACAIRYSDDLKERNRAIAEHEITWEQYYNHGNTRCLLHQESLLDYLLRIKGSHDHLWDTRLGVCARCGERMDQT